MIKSILMSLPMEMRIRRLLLKSRSSINGHYSDDCLLLLFLLHFLFFNICDAYHLNPFLTMCSSNCDCHWFTNTPTIMSCFFCFVFYDEQLLHCFFIFLMSRSLYFSLCTPEEQSYHSLLFFQITLHYSISFCLFSSSHEI